MNIYTVIVRDDPHDEAWPAVGQWIKLMHEEKQPVELIQTRPFDSYIVRMSHECALQLCKHGDVKTVNKTLNFE